MRRGGIIFFKWNGRQYDVKGEATYNLGKAKRTAIVGRDRVHGFTEEVQVPFVELELTDAADLDLAELVTAENGTAVLELANGKIIVLRDGWFAGAGDVTSNEGVIKARFEGLSCTES